MSKAVQGRPHSARQKIAAQQASARRDDLRKKTLMAACSGASYDPGLLAGLSWGQIAADLAEPASPVGRAIDATANRITAAIRTMTGGKPGDVCTSTGITSASGSI